MLTPKRIHCLRWTPPHGRILPSAKSQKRNGTFTVEVIIVEDSYFLLISAGLARHYLGYTHPSFINLMTKNSRFGTKMGIKHEQLIAQGFKTNLISPSFGLQQDQRGERSIEMGEEALSPRISSESGYAHDPSVSDLLQTVMKLPTCSHVISYTRWS